MGITAVVFHLLNTGAEDFPLGIPKAHSYNFELAAMYVFVLGYFTVAGAGKYSSTSRCSAASSTSTVSSSTRSSARRSEHGASCPTARGGSAWRVAVRGSEREWACVRVEHEPCVPRATGNKR